MEKKIILPEGYELVESGNEYIVRKKGNWPRTWEEFCNNNPVISGESYITINSEIHEVSAGRRVLMGDRNLCISKEEAEAFLALMQLRQLRKAWVGDWKFTEGAQAWAIVAKKDGTLEIGVYGSLRRNMLFPTGEMAKEFLDCFRGLCETAKTLL